MREVVEDWRVGEMEDWRVMCRARNGVKILTKDVESNLYRSLAQPGKQADKQSPNPPPESRN